MQPTLFSTDDPAGGVSLHDAGILAGGVDEHGGEGDRGGGGGGVGRGDAAKRAGAGGAKLLNAWEKIEELEGLVESSRSHNERYDGKGIRACTLDSPVKQIALRAGKKRRRRYWLGGLRFPGFFHRE